MIGKMTRDAEKADVAATAPRRGPGRPSLKDQIAALPENRHRIMVAELGGRQLETLSLEEFKALKANLERERRGRW